MLPRSLYEILPYLYLATGIAAALLIRSRLVSIASALMIMAGVIILYLRISNRRKPEQQRLCSDSGQIRVHSHPNTERSVKDRRRSPATRFPLLDSTGNIIEVNRRIGERRLSVV